MSSERALNDSLHQAEFNPVASILQFYDNREQCFTRSSSPIPSISVLPLAVQTRPVLVDHRLSSWGTPQLASSQILRTTVHRVPAQ